jgi:hypothetical protein
VHGLFPRVAQKIEISVLGSQVVRGEFSLDGRPDSGENRQALAMSRIKGAKKVGFPVGTTAAFVVWALSRKPGDAQTAQKAGLRARGDRHRQAPLLWNLPSESSEFQRGMSRVIARIAGPRTRISRSDDEKAKCSAPGSAQGRDCDVGSASIFYLAAPGIPERLSRASQTRHDGANRQGCDN